MTPPEHTTKTPKAATGVFALLRGLLRVKGTTTPFVILLALGALLLTATPALANSAHGYERAFGSGPGSAAGQLELVAPYREAIFSQAGRGEQSYYSIAGSGVAVEDTNHDVYVADTGNSRVDEFGPGGEFLLAFGANVGGPGSGTCMLVSGCKKGAVGTTPGQFADELPSPRFVAVDNAPGPSHGDVYVGEGVGTPAQNETQFVDFNGATGGTFTLTYEGKETSAIPFTTVGGNNEREDPDVVNTEAALEALTGDHGELLVREQNNPGGEAVALSVEFRGALAETVTPELSCDGAGLAPAGTNCETYVGHLGSKPAEEAIEKFSSGGVLETGWGDGGPGGTPDGRLDVGEALGGIDGELQGVTVAPSGDLWVEDRGTVYRFEEAGKQIATPTEVGLAPEPAEGIAVNAAGELYVAEQAVKKYQERGGLFQGVGPVSEAHDPGPTGFALDSASETVYLGLGDALEQGVPAEVFGAPQLQGSAGVAVDSSTGKPPFSGAVYAANTVADQVDVDTLRLAAETSAASDVGVASMTLHGTVDPEGTPVEECSFEYGASEVNGEYEHAVPCEHPDAAELGSGTGEVPVEAQISGLRGGVTYHFRVVARKGSTTVPGDDLQASTPPAPVISGEEATEVTASGARLSALVDPEGLPVTRCEFEYVPAAKYEASAANPYGEGDAVRCEQGLAQIGFGTEPVPVSARIAGLEANVTYHWRLSVRDEHGAAYALDNTFVYPASSPELPDHRAYEMVTPPFKNGASVGTVFIGLPAGIAASGERVIATSIQCFDGSRSCTVERNNKEGEPFEFTRSDEPGKCAPAAPPCWFATPLAPPSTLFSENNAWMIDPDEGTALFSMPTPPPAGNGEDDYYARETDGSFADVGPTTPPVQGPSKKATEYMRATAGFSHLVVDDEYHVWPFATPSGPQVIEYTGTSDSQPFLVGVDVEDKPFEACDTVLGATSQEQGWNPVSADGGTVYFTACPTTKSQLYARVDGETGEAHTVKISGAGQAKFIGASADGSRAFFTEGGNLFESECTAHCQGSDKEALNGEELEEHREPIDLSAPEVAGEAPEVQGVAAISADGSHVYFVANGVLAPGARRGHCPAAGSSCNLYVYERDERYPQGHIAFVARLPQADAGYDWGHSQSANVTPDGRFLVFESEGDLTSDDTRSDGYTQVFRYDADPSEQEEREHVPALVRVSIGRDGYDDDGNGGIGDAVIAEPGSGSNKPDPQRRDPTMSDDGSYVFFQSSVGLTANALNDVQIGTRSREEPAASGKFIQLPVYAENVYEWEAPGTVLDGQVACTQESGCVYLISDGRDVNEGTGSEPCYENLASTEFHESATCLMGTDASGHDVFFMTADQLVPKDTDTQVDIYDARICEPETGNPCVTEPPPPLPPCGGEQCHGIPEATPSLLAPGTASFNGEGNIALATPAPAVKPKALTRSQKLTAALRICRKDKSKKKRVVCEKQAKKKYGAESKAKKSSKKKGK